jgi:hypothetical protein
MPAILSPVQKFISVCCFLTLCLGLNFRPVYSAPRSKVSVEQKAALAETAFLAIWLDSGLEDVLVEEDVRHALNAGVHPNTRDKYGDTLLFQAIENGRFTIVQMLIKRGVDVNQADLKTGEIPLMRAQSSVEWEPQDVVRALLRAGADPNRRDKQGNIPLMLARNAEIARMLIWRGAQINAVNHWGDTPLISAAASGNVEIARVLLKAGADFRLRNKKGATALQAASLPVIRGDVDYGGGMPNLPDTKNEKVLEEGVRKYYKQQERQEIAEEEKIRRGRAEIRKLLLKAGAKQ